MRGSQQQYSWGHHTTCQVGEVDDEGEKEYYVWKVGGGGEDAKGRLDVAGYLVCSSSHLLSEAFFIADEKRMMPEDDTYGTWPASGEIDIMEARGNSMSHTPTPLPKYFHL